MLRAMACRCSETCGRKVTGESWHKMGLDLANVEMPARQSRQANCSAGATKKPSRVLGAAAGGGRAGTVGGEAHGMRVFAVYGKRQETKHKKGGREIYRRRN